MSEGYPKFGSLWLFIIIFPNTNWEFADEATCRSRLCRHARRWGSTNLSQQLVNSHATGSWRKNYSNYSLEGLMKFMFLLTPTISTYRHAFWTFLNPRCIWQWPPDIFSSGGLKGWYHQAEVHWSVPQRPRNRRRRLYSATLVTSWDEDGKPGGKPGRKSRLWEQHACENRKRTYYVCVYICISYFIYIVI